VSVGANGSVVVVERDVHVPFDPAPLTRLPFAVEAGRPLFLLDTETTGLGTAAGTLAFLIGMAWWDGETLRVVQLWLPDHPDEGALLDALAAYVPANAWLVTYNGRTFDWPLITTRYRLAHREPPELAGHLDLLPISRALFKHRLPDARLASVESGVAGVRRIGDLPGALIPDRYFGWLRRGEADPLREVLEHNHQDVVSMARLLIVLTERMADTDGHARAHPGDLVGLARVYRRRGRVEDALACLGAALALPDPERHAWGGAAFERGQAWIDQATLFSSQRRWEDAAQAWEEAIRCGGRTAVQAWIGLAKHREHRLRDPVGALAAATTAERLVAQRRAIGRFDVLAERDLGRRLRRLRFRVARGQAAADRRKVRDTLKTGLFDGEAGGHGGQAEVPAA
jgi:tetratricopeptide (TPR) repeat protein